MCVCEYVCVCMCMCKSVFLFWLFIWSCTLCPLFFSKFHILHSSFLSLKSLLLFSIVFIMRFLISLLLSRSIDYLYSDLDINSLTFFNRLSLSNYLLLNHKKGWWRWRFLRQRRWWRCWRILWSRRWGNVLWGIMMLHTSVITYCRIYFDCSDLTTTPGSLGLNSYWPHNYTPTCAMLVSHTSFLTTSNIVIFCQIYTMWTMIQGYYSSFTLCSF